MSQDPKCDMIFEVKALVSWVLSRTFVIYTSLFAAVKEFWGLFDNINECVCYKRYLGMVII